ncbi:MAG: hypothetical protein RR922_04480 [Clostridia bacterium]
MKKYIIFSHKVDIDGLGSIILAKLAFGKENVDYQLCMPGDINEKISKYLNNNELEKYNRIFVTDICMTEPLIGKIDLLNEVKNKITVWDHHMNIAKSFNKDYSWINLKFENEKGLVCGTSMFYEYLISENLLKQNKALDEFVELTRQYDTWEWVTKYNNEKARDLTLLMDSTSPDLYIELVLQNLVKQKSRFNFTNIENTFIENKKKDIEQYVKKCIDNMQCRVVDGAKIGVIFAELYRNEMKPEIYKRKIDIDAVCIYKIQEGTASWRSISKNFNVLPFAEKYGGNGHTQAAGSKIYADDVSKIINILLKI